MFKTLEMSAKSKKEIKAQVEALSKKVEHFSKSEIGCLIQMFNALLAEQVGRCKRADGLDKGSFKGILQSIFGMTNAMMMEGVFRCFDRDSDGIITVEEWVKGFSVFLRGTLDEKIKHCFRVYDLNNDKYISKEEIFHMLKHTINQPNEEDPDEGIKDIVEITMKKMDHDEDGMLSCEDFEKSVKENCLFIEAFGTCLPNPMCLERFERLLFQEQKE